MRKFLQKNKPAKPSKDFGEDIAKQSVPTPLYQKLATQSAHIHGAISLPLYQQSTLSPPPGQQEAIGLLPNPHSPPSKSGDHLERKLQSAVGALGILSSLEPAKGAVTGSGTGTGGSGSWGTISGEEGKYLGNVTDIGLAGYVIVDKEKEKKKGFWNVRDRDKEREKEREREQPEREAQLRKEREERELRERGRELAKKEEEPSGELTRMIGYLTATAAEDWGLLMEVCDRSSATIPSAKEAVRALRREFKYGEPHAQLSAARVWAVMLRNSSEIFISQSTSRKFLDTIEDLLTSSRTSPVVRERLLEVVAAAAYASGSKKGHDGQGFKGLWKKVRPSDKPEEGVPFDTEDAMFQPPQSAGRPSYDIPTLNFQEPNSPDPSSPNANTVKKRKIPSKQIISLEEDMRRLFQECKIGQGNAAVLADALLRAKPDDLRKVDVIKEFHAKCLASQELICAQIPWATSLAERSRPNNSPENVQQQRNIATSAIASGNNDGPMKSPVVELTVEEKLLAELLAANAELLEVLRQWEDLNRLAVEDRSRRDVRMNRSHQEGDYEGSLSAEAGHLRVSSSRTPSPPSRSNSPVGQPTTAPSSFYHSDHAYKHRQTPSLHDFDGNPNNSNQSQQQNLAPPPAAPHGPRSPTPVPVQRSGPPSPTPMPPLGLPQVNGHVDVGGHDGDSDSLSSLEEVEVPVQPSAKALGKRKVVDVAVSSGQPDAYEKFRSSRLSYQSTNTLDPEFADDQDSRWRHPPVRFVYDAVAERRRQLVSESREQQHRVNGVH